MRDSNERALRRLVTKDNAHIASSSFYGLVGEMGIRKNRAASSWTQWDLSHPDFLFCSSSALKTWKETTKKERKWCHLADWFAIPSQRWNKEKKKKILYECAIINWEEERFHLSGWIFGWRRPQERKKRTCCHLFVIAVCIDNGVVDTGQLDMEDASMTEAWPENGQKKGEVGCWQNCWRRLRGWARCWQSCSKKGEKSSRFDCMTGPFNQFLWQ